MPTPAILLVVMDATDNTTILGAARVESIPDFPPNAIVHSSNPDLPLHNKAPAFFRINLCPSPSRQDLAIIEAVKDPSFQRREMPPMWIRGHRITLTFFSGTSQYEDYQVPPLWEVMVNDKTIGAIDDGPVYEVAREALAMANSYIEEAISTRKSAF